VFRGVYDDRTLDVRAAPALEVGRAAGAQRRITPRSLA